MEVDNKIRAHDSTPILTWVNKYPEKTPLTDGHIKKKKNVEVVQWKKTLTNSTHDGLVSIKTV